MNELTVLSWNVQGHGKNNISRINRPTPFKKILPVIESTKCDIVCLQEMPDAVEKIAQSEYLAKNYHVFIPKMNANEASRAPSYNHNVILSRYPIENPAEIEFEETNGVPIENVTRVDIRTKSNVIRLYNCHLAIKGVGVATRLAQLEKILSDTETWNGPIIVCGDMNTTTSTKWVLRKVFHWWNGVPKEELHVGGQPIKEHEKALMNEAIRGQGFTDNLHPHTPTWSPFKTTPLEIFGLKLDWFITKNLSVTNIDLGDYVSDHRPVIAKIKQA